MARNRTSGTPARPQADSTSNPSTSEADRVLAGANRPGFESLEPRLLLSATPVVQDEPQPISTMVIWQGEEVEAFAGRWIAKFDDTGAGMGTLLTELQATMDAAFLVDTSGAGDVISGPVTTLDTLGGDGFFRITADPSLLFGDVLDNIQSLDGFDYLEPDFVQTINVLPDDPRLGELFGLNNTGQSGGTPDADIDAPEAWDLSTGSTGVVVGVIDTGIDYRHQDLYQNVWLNQREIPAVFASSLTDFDNDGLITFRDLNESVNASFVTDFNGTGYIDAGDLLVDARWEDATDQDGNGFVDDLIGWDFVNNDNDPFDDNRHGTHVSGTIAATGNNALGVVGVNWTSQIMGLKFLSSGGSGSTSNAISAINYATSARQDGTNIRVTNNSWGGGGFSSSLLNAINAGGTQGILFVAAAGNDGRNSDGSAFYPASYNSASIISVAATDRNDNKASFSNYGATTVDLAAPGVAILSTLPNNQYGNLNGTSMASPHVAAVAALAWSVSPNATAQKIKDAILNGADPVASMAGRSVTGGRLNAFNTVSSLGLSIQSTTPTQDQTVATALTEFTVVFAADIDTASVQASDLEVNGVPASGFVISDSRTVAFQFASSPLTTEGPQSMSLNTGVVARLGDGLTNNQLLVGFRYDATPIGVTSMTPGNGSTVATPLNTLALTFNEPVDSATLGLKDLALSVGTVTSVNQVSPTQIEFGLAGLETEGAVEVTLPAGAVTDLFGNTMTTEFHATLFVDIGVSPFPTPLSAVQPLGGQVFEGEANGIISSPTDTDSFTIELDAGQSVTLRVLPDAGFQPQVGLLSPETVLLGSATAGAVGEAALLQSITVSTAGLYTIMVWGVSGTGAYAVQLSLNAAVEEEGNGGPGNDTITDGQDLTGSFVDLGGGVSRAAVLGEGPGVDVYRFDLVAGETASFAIEGLDGAVAGIELLGGLGELLANGIDSLNADQMIADFVAPATRSYFVRVNSDGRYNLILIRGAAFSSGLTEAQDITLPGAVLGHLGGSPVAVPGPSAAVTGPFDVLASPLSLGFARDGSFVGQSIGARHNGVEFLRFGTFLAGYSVAFNGMRFTNASPSGSSAFSVSIEDLSSTGLHRFRITATVSTSLAFERTVSWEDGDSFATIRTVLQNISGSTLNNVALLENQDPDPGGTFNTANDVTLDGALVVGAAAAGAMGLGSDDPRAIVSAEGFVITNPFDVINSPIDPNGSMKDIAINIAFDIGALAPGESADMTFAMVFGTNQLDVETKFGAIDLPPGGIGGGDDQYSVSVNAGDVLTITTSTPGDGPFEPLNLLDPAIEVIDPDGVVVAADSNTAPDGRNVQLSFTAAVTGTYTIRVLDEGAGPGDYLLSVNGSTASTPPLRVSQIDPADGSGVTVSPTEVTVDFSSPVRLSSVNPGDLTIDGIPATAVAFLDGDTVVFDIPGTIKGSHVIEIAEGAIIGLNDAPLEAFTSSFNLSLDPILPLGSLAYDPPLPGQITNPGDVEEYLFSLDPDQTITLVADPTGALQPVIELMDPSGATIALSEPLGVGDQVLIQTAATTTAGTYTIRVSGDLGTTGDFELQLLLNTAIDRESNNTTAAPQDLEPAYLNLAGPGKRAAAIGSVSGFDDDFYRIRLVDHDVVTIAVTSLSGGTPLVDLINRNGLRITSGQTDASNVSSVIRDLQVTGKLKKGDFFVRVYGSGDYSLVVTKDASFDLEPNNDPAQAQDITGTNSVLGFVGAALVPGGAIDLQDYFTINVEAGDELTIETDTPADGPFSFGNILDPAIELFDPDGVLVATDFNSAADGRNARLTYTPSVDGQFIVRILPEAGTLGEYVLNIDGSEAEPTPFHVSSINPTDGTRMGSSPSAITVDFDRPLLLTSVKASDLKLDGVSSGIILSFSDQSVTFSAPIFGEGVHTITIKAGAIQDIRGADIVAFTSQFTVDQTAPRIIASSILQGDIVPAGDVVYTAQFDEGIKTSNLDASDFLLTGVIEGTVSADRFSFDDATNILTVEFDSLPEDNYILTLRSGGGAIEDVLGIDMDGEINSVGTVPSGDGVPGGDFVVGFEVDITTVTFPTPLSEIAPQGGLTFEGHTVGVIGNPVDTDSFTIMVDPGQTLTVLVRPTAPGLQPVVELRDPGSSLIDSATAAGPGEPALIQTAHTVAGLYTIAVRSEAGTTGAYSVELFINAAWEQESLGGPANDTIADAQSLAGAFIDLGASAARAVVLGEGPGLDVYRFTLNAGDAASVVINLLASGDVGIELLDAAATVLANGIDAVNADKLIADFVAPTTGDYFIRVDSDTRYSLLLTRNTAFETKALEDASDPQDISTTGSVLGHLKGGPVGAAVDSVIKMGLIQDRIPWGRLSNNAIAAELGYSVTTILSSSLSSIDLSAFDIIVMAGDQTATTYSRVAANMSVIESFVNDGGTWVVNYAAGSLSTPYRFDVLPGAEGLAFTGFNSNDTNVLDPSSGLIVGAGGVIGDSTLDRSSSASHAFSTGPIPAGGNAILSTNIPSRVVALDYPFGGGSVIVHTIPVEFFNGGPHGIGLVFHRNLFDFAGDQTQSGPDTYSLEVNPGDVLTIKTTTPGDGPLEPVNGLDPAIELIDPTGAVVATDSNSAPDGRNALITFTAIMAGTYTIKVTAEGADPGDYLLEVTGQTGPLPAFEVVGSDPMDGETFTTQPTEMTIDFSDPLLLSSLQASDLMIGGETATAVTVIDHDTAVFELPSLADGIHTATLEAGAVADLQGTAVAAFTSSFEIDSTAPRLINSSIQLGDVLGAGSLTYTAVFDEQLIAASLNASDVSLVGISSGSHTPSVFNYDPTTSTLTLEYVTLPEDQFTLTLFSGNGRFEDLFGLDLDGEPVAFPIPPNSSGDGVPGGNFFVSFSTDIGTTAFPVPLSPIEPAGGLVYDGEGTGVIGHPGDIDRFTIDLDAGQTVTVLLDGGSAFQGSIEWLDPSGASIGAATAAGPGEQAVLQTVSAPTAGTYTLVIGGEAGSTGGFTARLILNAAVESEEHDGPDNSTPADAQNLDLAFIGLGPNVSRAAVLGTANTAGGVLFLETFPTTTFNTANWSLVDTANIDSVGINEPSSPYSARLNGSPNGSDLIQSKVINLAGLSSADLSYYFEQRGGGEEPDSGDDLFLEYRTASGSWVQLDRQFGSTPGTSSFTQRIIALPAGAFHSNFQFRFRSQVTSGPFDDWFVDDIQLTANGLPGNGDWYSLSLNDGQLVTLAIGALGGASALELELYDATGTTLLASGVPTDRLDQVIDGFVDTTTDGSPDTYLARVTGNGEYNLLLTRGASFDTEPNNDPAEAQDINATGAVLGHVGVNQPAPAAEATVFLPINLTDGTGFLWDIQRNGSINNGTRDAYDGGLRRTGFSNSFSTGQSEDGGREIRIDELFFLGSLQHTRKIFVPADAGFARYLEIITNTSSSTVLHTLTISTNLGSDSGTRLIGTDTGGSFTTNDNWLVTDDFSNGGGDPTMLHVVSGPDGLRPTTVFQSRDSISFSYDLTLAPGETQIIMHFASQNTNQATALAKAPQLADLQIEQALSGLSPEEMRQIVNFQAGAGSLEDRYTIIANAGEVLRLKTTTPGGGPGEFVNILDPAIELIDPTGAVVATDSNSAPDGRNAQINFTAALTGTYTIRVTAEGDTGGEYLLSADAVAPAVVARNIFYNYSAFDGYDPLSSPADDAALATDKTALLPGQAATFANYTSFNRGINGVMIDISRLVNPGGLSAADFDFRIGNSNDPSTWNAAPVPVSITVRQGQGVGGADRVTIIWPDNAIQNTWLQITVRAGANTGLPVDDVFYFGNAIGETGNSATDAVVDAVDEINTQDNAHAPADPATAEDVYDFNRDRRVDMIDQLITGDYVTSPGSALKLINLSDLSADGFVGVDDLNIILNNWNTDGSVDPRSDVNGDGFVGIDDLNLLISNWNTGSLTAASEPLVVSQSTSRESISIEDSRPAVTLEPAEADEPVSAGSEGTPTDQHSTHSPGQAGKSDRTAGEPRGDTASLSQTQAAIAAWDRYQSQASRSAPVYQGFVSRPLRDEEPVVLLGLWDDDTAI